MADLVALFREALHRFQMSPDDAALKALIEDLGRALLSCAESHEGEDHADVVGPFNQALQALEEQQGWRDLKERFALALASRAGPQDQVQARTTAGRLMRLALDESPGPRTTRLLSVASRLYHDVDDGTGEAKAEVTRFTLELAERPVAQVAPLSVDPEIFLSTIPEPPTTSPGRPHAPDGPPSSPSEVPRPQFKAGSQPVPLPPSSREALQLVRHLAGHPGVPMDSVIVSITDAFCSSSRASEGILWIEAVADLPESRQWEGPLFECSLKLCETKQASSLHPSMVLRAYWRIATRGPPSTSSNSADWGERLHGSLASWTERTVGSPPLTVWDVILAAGIPAAFLRLPPPDLSSWASSVRREQPAPLGADAGPLRAAMKDVIDRLKQNMEHAGETNGGFADRMRKRLRTNPYEPPLVLLEGMQDMIPGAPPEG
jgi:hypothetical protein